MFVNTKVFIKKTPKKLFRKSRVCMSCFCLITIRFYESFIYNEMYFVHLQAVTRSQQCLVTPRLLSCV